MRNAKSIVTVYTHTDNLDAIVVALFSVALNKYCKLEANKLV